MGAWIAQLVEHFPEEEGVPGSSPGPSTSMVRKLFLWIQARERHLSAFAMLAGFVIDNLFFVRVDLLQTHIAFASYTLVCFGSITALHFIESRVAQGKSRPRWRPILPIMTQFALGGFWSGFVIFYGRAADLGVSWPFLLTLVLIFFANEYFSRYHARLVFTSTLFFFALYSYALFAVPIVTGSIGVGTFVLSGVAALSVFYVFTKVLRSIAKEQFLSDIWRIRAGAALVFVFFNVLYFTNILPPLPLSAEAAGVYHSVWRTPGVYKALEERQPFMVRYLGFTPTLHLTLGEELSAYSSIFAPTTLTTTVIHRWQHYDAVKKEWVTTSTIAYPIVGGRDGGYRGYSSVPLYETGKWRVSIETSDGRRITRLPFIVEEAMDLVTKETIELP